MLAPHPVLGNLKRGLLFILSAPAGTGKTTLVRLLMNEFPCVVASVSFTTREPRGKEVDGVDYHFLKEEEFVSRIAAGEFLEYVKLYGHYYGTSRTWVEQQLEKGKHVVLVIDTQGARLLRKKIEFEEGEKRQFGVKSAFVTPGSDFSQAAYIQQDVSIREECEPALKSSNIVPKADLTTPSLVTIFVSPPSIDELENRLKERKTESIEVIEQRLAWAREEIRAQNEYDYVIVNDDLALAYQVLRSIFIAEEHRIR